MWMETYNKFCMSVFTFLEKFSLPMNDGSLATDCCETNYPKTGWLKTIAFVMSEHVWVGNQAQPSGAMWQCITCPVKCGDDGSPADTPCCLLRDAHLYGCWQESVPCHLVDRGPTSSQAIS